MSEIVNLTIDGREITAPKGTTIIEAARSANIQIPHLCHNEELHPYGACRLCLVEISHKKRTRIVASCIYEVDDGLSVQTETKRVLDVRKMVIELMLIRNPEHPVLNNIAQNLGIKSSRFDVEPKGCILCGMCVRVCREVVGVSAIGFKSRGFSKEVATPFDDSPADCIACGSCAYVCPVDYIPMEEKKDVRTIWNTDFELQKCNECGRVIAPVKQLEYFKKRASLSDKQFEKCLHCR